jgi:carboxypeptidase family protein
MRRDACGARATACCQRAPALRRGVAYDEVMRSRTLLALAILGVVGWFALRDRGDAEAEVPAPAAPVRDTKLLSAALRVAEAPPPTPPAGPAAADEIDPDEAEVIYVDADGNAHPDSEPGSVAEHAAELAKQQDHGGVIWGFARDRRTGEELAGVTVTVESPALSQVQAAITDEHGLYMITGLPSGEYKLTAYYLAATLVHPDIIVSERRATPVFTIIDTDPRDVERDEIGVQFTGSTNLEDAPPPPPPDEETLVE